MNAYIDSNIFIYIATNHPTFSKPCKALLTRVQNKTLLAVTSAIILCEVQHAITKNISQTSRTRHPQHTLPPNTNNTTRHQHTLQRTPPSTRTQPQNKRRSPPRNSP